jgi:hypothetical protein
VIFLEAWHDLCYQENIGFTFDALTLVPFDFFFGLIFSLARQKDAYGKNTGHPGAHRAHGNEL